MHPIRSQAKAAVHPVGRRGDAGRPLCIPGFGRLEAGSEAQPASPCRDATPGLFDAFPALPYPGVGRG